MRHQLINLPKEETLADASALSEGIVRLRGDKPAPDMSVVIPVNARGDLENVRWILNDLLGYRGQHSVEIVLVINNYDAGDPPREIEEFSACGLRVAAVPSVRQDGECVGFTARVYGARMAASESVIQFDADCRVVDPTALLDWYVAELNGGMRAAYTHVGYFEVIDNWPNRVRLLVHHAARWSKRVLLKIPTLRGSNYAISRSVLLGLYEDGWLADDMNVGPTFRASGLEIAYSGAANHVVLTSGRMFSGTSWMRLNAYFLRRLKFNLRVLRVRPNAALYTKRELDPERRYVNNRPVC